MTHGMVALSCLFALAASSGTSAPSGASPPVRRTPKAAAAAALQQIGALAGDPRFGELGVSTRGGRPPEVGEPVPEVLVRLDELARFAPGADAARLLHESGAWLVPVLSGGEVVSAISVARQKGGYAMVAVGDAALARDVAAQLRSPGSCRARLVRIPALRLVLVARGAGKALVLVPVASDARFQLEAGRAEPAAAILERLAPAARAQPGNVPG